MFKVGDKVRCVISGRGLRECIDEGVYVVEEAANGLTIKVSGLREWWGAYRFVPADEPAADKRPPFKKGDRVRCIDDENFHEEGLEGCKGLVQKGKVYTVGDYEAYDEGGGSVTIGHWHYAPRRFVLADEPAAEIVQYATGAVRSADAESVRYDLISPIALERWAKTCHEGAQKYGDYNWEKGMAVSVMINHTFEHLRKYLAGDRSEDHLGHALWNIAGAIHSEELWPELNHNLRGPNCTPPKEPVKP